jgi:hypothetical protein
MRIGLVTNFKGRGLECDARLITPLIESAGHTVERLQYDEKHHGNFDLLIFLEVVPRHLVRLSDTPPWVIVNPEFLVPEYISTIRRSFGRVFSKTHEAQRISKGLFGDKAEYIGFLSEDRFDESIERQMTFLHVAGHSKAKGTDAIIDAWRWTRNGERLKAKLTVITDFPPEDVPEGVTILENVTDAELKRLQNECQFHLQPSQTEGWSHVIHEAMSVNATILTVDAPPMNEIKSAYRIPSCGSTLFNLVRMYEVSALDIYTAVSTMAKFKRQGYSQAGAPRSEFLDAVNAFKEAFTAQLATAGQSAAVRNEKASRTIAFIGNFEAEHSTENQILWALEQRLGYEVDKLQENRISAEDIEDAALGARALLWVRTPGWLQITNERMFEVLEYLKRRKVVTASIHLDKFWDIPEREALIGKIPFWKTDYVFTADGSRQDDFKARGVNHIWMRPAVSEVYCHPGTPREEYRCDVGFVGAKGGYHSEYPFRQKMVEFLEETYGSRFKHIQGVRGHLLNDVYASMKVVVGDCFGAGIPYYWSDRLPETCGRHGFLLHPEVEGLDIPTAEYRSQDISHLQIMVDYWLREDSGRLDVLVDCAERVKLSHTWTIRMAEIMEQL